MARRSHPTARQERLGAELKKLREQAGVTARDAARVVGMDQAKMSHLEAGRAAAGEERVRKLASHYGVSDAALVDALAVMASERVRGWWEEYRDVLPHGFLDLAELEYHASYLHAIEITQIPGILQLEDHARAVFEYVASDLAQAELDARVEYRMRRRGLFDRDSPPAFEAVIHEAALRIRVSSRSVARAQLRALVEASERDNVTIRVIPFETDGFASAGYSMLHVGGPVPQLDTVQLDTVHSGVFLSEEPQLSKHRHLYSKVRAHSLEPAESRALMYKVTQEL